MSVRFRKEAEQFVEDALNEADYRRSKEYPGIHFGGTIAADVSHTLKQVLIEKIETLMQENYYDSLGEDL